MILSSGTGEMKKERGTGGSHRNNTKHFPMASQDNTIQWLGQHVCDHVFCGEVLDLDLAVGDTFTNKMVSSVDVLGSSMMFWVES